MCKPTDNQTATLRGAIDALMRRFKIAESEVGGSKPLNQIDNQVLFYVSTHPGCGPTDVARYLGVAPTTISSATDRLVRRDFLNRARPEINRRAISLNLTAAGKGYVSELIGVQMDHCRLMLDHLSAEEQDNFIALITKISKYDN